MSKSGLPIIIFLLGAFSGMILLAAVSPNVLENIPEKETQQFDQIFEVGDVKIGITVDEDTNPRTKETTELLIEQFTFHLARAVEECETKHSTEPLNAISEALRGLTD